MTSGPLRFNVESIAFLGPFCKISGWAFLEGGPIASLWLASEGPSGTDSAKLVPGQARPDVFDHHQHDNARMSGFVGQGLILTGHADIWLVAHSSTQQTVREHIGRAILTEEGAFIFEPGQLSDFIKSKKHRGPVKLGELHDLPPQYYATSFLPSIAAALPAIPAPSPTPVSILSSVYKGREYLDDFFGSFAKNTEIYNELIIVDNGNTDPDLIQYLEISVAKIPRARLVRVETNEGYIEGIIHANAAREHDGHVVVLNTDIILPLGWLERLLWPLDNLQDIATATPFTNAGTCCSFPYTAIDNLIYRNLPVKAIDDFFRCCDPAALYQDIPSGVGFCMALHRDMLHKIGYFEPCTFGLGYGEENDWSLKAEALGWHNILVPNLFVYHKHGGVYPSEQKRKLIDQNLKIIFERYPHYGTSVATYFGNDKAGGLREFAAFKIAVAAAKSHPVLRMYEAATVAALTGHLAASGFSINIYHAPSRSAWLAVLQAESDRWLLWGVGEAELYLLLSALDCFEQIAISA